jgi:hypothetical protein
MEACECATTGELCDRCLANTHGQLGGVAMCRGEYLADRVAALTAIREPWPDTEKADRFVAAKVADLTRDGRLLEMLAKDAKRFAVKRWEQIRAGSPVRTPMPVRRRS